MAARWFAKKRAICAVATGLVVLAIALGVGLGVGLAKRAQQTQAAAPATCTPADGGVPIALSASPAANTSRRVGAAFVSFAFEFSSFAVFAGNTSDPNEYSNNLLNNLGNLTGTKPYIRVGGTSADEAILNTQLGNATTHKANTDNATGIQQTLTYGESYFESFTTWPDARYIFAFDMAVVLGYSADVGFLSLNATVPLVCNVLADNDRFLYWEYGNEPNLYPTPSHGVVKAADWSDQRYVAEWTNGTAVIKAQLQADPHCTGLAGPDFGFIGPSIWLPSTRSEITLDGVWTGGLDSTGLISLISMHRYLTKANASATIESALLNHSLSVASLAGVVDQYNGLGAGVPPLILGESNSLSNVGIEGVTDTLAGGLWAMNWALLCAARNVTRVHFQQGVGFWYNAWQPVSTNGSFPAGTKPPYYGHLAAAAALGESAQAAVQVLALALPSDTDTDAAYAVYSDGALARVAVLNLQPYRAGDGARGTTAYTFSVPAGARYRSVNVRRLLGPASDARDGVQWDGQQFDLLPNNGLATATGNVTTGESFLVCNGSVSVELDHSSAAVLEFSA